MFPSWFFKDQYYLETHSIYRRWFKCRHMKYLKLMYLDISLNLQEYLMTNLADLNFILQIWGTTTQYIMVWCSFSMVSFMFMSFLGIVHTMHKSLHRRPTSCARKIHVGGQHQSIAKLANVLWIHHVSMHYTAMYHRLVYIFLRKDFVVQFLKVVILKSKLEEVHL